MLASVITVSGCGKKQMCIRDRDDHFVVPDPGEDLFAREDHPRLGKEQGEDFELLFGQGNLLAVHPADLALQVEAEPFETDGFLQMCIRDRFKMLGESDALHDKLVKNVEHFRKGMMAAGFDLSLIHI